MEGIGKNRVLLLVSIFYHSGLMRHITRRKINSPSSQKPKVPLTHLPFETEMLQRDVLVPLTVLLGWFLWSMVGFLFNSSLPPSMQDLGALCHTRHTAGLKNLAE